MFAFAQRCYQLLPHQLRPIAATVRGYQLRAWRYGPKTEQEVEESLNRDYWPVERWAEWQDQQLRRMLRHAVSEVPYYRAQWQNSGVGDRCLEHLSNWPILEKKAVASDPASFVAAGANSHALFRSHTSGTTGTPLTLWNSRETLRAWYALAEARWRRWYGVSRRDRWAILGGQMVVPVQQRHPPFWVWNAAFRQLYMSSYHLSSAMCVHYLEAIKRYKIVYVLGYTSALYALAQQALRLRSNDLRMKVVLTNAEPLYDYQRSAISRAFQCPVRETYGMSEKVAAASECEHGRLHLWPEVGVVEVVDESGPVSSGEVGDVLATTLICREMPLVRYRCGDRLALVSGDADACKCGRTLPVIDRIEGRADDVLHTSDGRQIGRLDPVFKCETPIEEAQIIQESLNRLRVLYVPLPGFTDAHKSQIIAELRARMGPVDVEMQEVAAVPRTENGKFRAVICQISTTRSPKVS